MIYLFLNNGGLGNQMFQYAMARRLQLEYDMNIVCDLTSFNYKGTNATKREYCLDAFTITDRMVYRKAPLPRAYSKMVKAVIAKRCPDPAERYKRLTGKGIYALEGYCDFYSEERAETANLYVKGLFQAHRYFDNIQPVLKEDFTFRHAPSNAVGELLGRIQNEEAVCIHWRRGDYLQQQYRDSLLVCSDSYYERGIQRMLQKASNPVFYVFTNSAEDAEWIRNNHGFPVPVHYINLMLEEEHTDLDDFRLMCACRHFILSNSTFSWWAQYLSPNLSKIVIAPSVWNRTIDASELYLDDWEVIPV